MGKCAFYLRHADSVTARTCHHRDSCQSRALTRHARRVRTQMLEIGSLGFHGCFSAQLQPLSPSRCLNYLQVINRACRRLLFISCTILDTSLGVKVSGDLAENSLTQFCIDRSLVEQRSADAGAGAKSADRLLPPSRPTVTCADAS